MSLNYLYNDMYTEDEGVVSNIPAFLSKLWVLVDDPQNEQLIAWDPNGTSFHIYDQARFAKDVLPFYFKHSNFASFIRQLNMYGFHKVSSVDSGNLKLMNEDTEFSHPYFIRGEHILLTNIKRKTKPIINKGLAAVLHNDDFSTLLAEINDLRGKQNSMSGKLESLKSENIALWREVTIMRSKHQTQQQIVNKLLQFLMNMAGKQRAIPTNSISRKRSLPMLGDSSDTICKLKRNKSSTSQLSPQLNYQVESPSSVYQPINDSICIEELAEQDDVLDIGEPLNLTSPIDFTSESSEHNDHMNITSNIISPDSKVFNTVSIKSEPTIVSFNLPEPEDDESENTPGELSSHVDSLQSQLEIMKDLFTNNRTFKLDNNSLSGLFSPEYPLSSEFPINIPLAPSNSFDHTDSALVTYNPTSDMPTLFDDLIDEDMIQGTANGASLSCGDGTLNTPLSSCDDLQNLLTSNQLSSPETID